MKKKILLLAVVTLALVLLLVFGALETASARTNCDSQPKPALDCPPGYSIMCIPVGGDHWGCGKESAGVILEANGVASSHSLPTQTGETSAQVDATVDVSIEKSKDKELQEAEGEDSANQQGGENQQIDRKNLSITVSGNWTQDEKAEIENAVSAQIQQNPSITAAEVSENSISMKYKTPGKLLWFIPISMNITLTYQSDGRVKVKFPWYKFLVATEYSQIAEEINLVFQNNESDIDFLEQEASVQSHVEAFTQISNILKVRQETKNLKQTDCQSACNRSCGANADCTTECYANCRAGGSQ